MRTIELAKGAAMPALGLGTWKSQPGEVGAAVTEALRLGYRHIDCARIYGNEKEVGAALVDAMSSGLVQRSELWVTSKLWNDRHAPADVRPALEESLADLGLEYLDLYLVHWPIAQRKGVLGPESASDFVAPHFLPLEATWEAMEALVPAGLASHIGVSNCSVAKLKALVASAAHRPEVNQVELHPYLQQPALLDYARGAGIALTAYSPLGSPDRPDHLRSSEEPVLLRDPEVAEIARELDASPAQVLIAWALARGTSVIPKSVSPERLAQNLAAAELALRPEDLRRIEALDRRRRYVDGTFWEVPGGPYTVASLWDE